VTNETGFISVVRRFGWMLALGTIVAALVANVVARLEQPTFAASATLLVGPLNSDYTSTQGAGDLARTYADIAKSLPVLKVVVARTGVAVDPTDLAEHVTATSNDVTRLVTLKVEAPSATRAATLANALAARMIELSSTLTPAESDTIRAFMGQREVQRLPAQTQDAVRAAAVRVFGPGTTGRLQMIAPAVPPRKAVAPRVALLTALGALAGLALCSVVALMLPAVLPPRRREVDPRAGIPLLGPVAGGSNGAAERRMRRPPERPRAPAPPPAPAVRRGDMTGSRDAG
jgi:capsular polysaccharide biosynthesis protein